MSTLLLGGLILSLAVLLSVSGLVFAQHRIPLELRQAHNVPISIIYGAISVTFGVIIGFSAYLVLDKYTTSQTTVANEASDVRALYYVANLRSHKPLEFSFSFLEMCWFAKGCTSCVDPLRNPLDHLA